MISSKKKCVVVKVKSHKDAHQNPFTIATNGQGLLTIFRALTHTGGCHDSAIPSRCQRA